MLIFLGRNLEKNNFVSFTKLKKKTIPGASILWMNPWWCAYCVNKRNFNVLPSHGYPLIWPGDNQFHASLHIQDFSWSSLHPLSWTGKILNAVHPARRVWLYKFRRVFVCFQAHEDGKKVNWKTKAACYWIFTRSANSAKSKLSVIFRA